MALFMDSDFSLLKQNQQKDLADFKALFGEQEHSKGESQRGKKTFDFLTGCFIESAFPTKLNEWLNYIVYYNKII